jgi:hypothetical protein
LLIQNIKKFKKHWNNLGAWAYGLEKFFFKYIVRNKGIKIMEEDWDNLIILDACRYDTFKQFNNISGDLEYRISRGSHTHEFLIENFNNMKFNDTIYITATPQTNCHVNKAFYKIIPIWKDGWNKDYETVLPKTMLKYSLEVNNKYPDKRLIIHFIQPHYPFIGEKGRKKIGYHIGIEGGENGLKKLKERWKGGAPKQYIWGLVQKGEINLRTIWEAYVENLEITLPYVKKLVKKLNGKTIISSDHGNLFGERIPPTFIRKFGHPEGYYTKNLIKVPWLVIENKKRKKIIEGEDLRKSEKQRIKSIVKTLKNI